MKIRENFGENRLSFVEEFKIIKKLPNNLHLATKIKKPGRKIFRVWRKTEENREIFDTILYGKLTFPQFSLNISWISASTPKVLAQ